MNYYKTALSDDYPSNHTIIDTDCKYIKTQNTYKDLEEITEAEFESHLPPVVVDEPETTVSTETMLAKMTANLLGVSAEYTPEQTEYIAKTAELTPIADNNEWKAGTWYAEGTIILYNGIHYEVIQGHISQDNWTPDKVPALFMELKADYDEWKQPQGGHDAYMKGDKVIYNGTKYISLIDGNTWSPTGYPQGWQKITE